MNFNFNPPSSSLGHSTSEDEDALTIPSFGDVINDEFEDSDHYYLKMSEDQLRRLPLGELRKRNEFIQHREAWRIKRKKLLHLYTQVSFFGEATAFSMYKLCWKLGQDHPELLWMAIVGVADQYLNGQISFHKYQGYCKELKDHMQRINHLRGIGIGMTRLPDSPIIDDSQPNLTNGSQSSTLSDLETIGGRNSLLHISFERDLQLVLYRHWSLFDSLQHTENIACCFKVWNARGYKKLLEFLAEIGLPLSESRQKYSSMELEMRKNVKEWMESLAEKYGLDNLIGESFIATKGYRLKFAACDVALAVRATLENPSDDLSMDEKFNAAASCFSWKDYTHLKEGFNLAKVQLMAMLKQVHDAIDLKHVKPAGPFLYIIIEEGAPDAKLLGYPAVLTALARFILHAYCVTSKREMARKMPLLLLAPDIRRPGRGFASGVPSLEENNDEFFFHKAFEVAAKQFAKKGKSIELDFTHICVAQFDFADRQMFIEELTGILHP